MRDGVHTAFDQVTGRAIKAVGIGESPLAPAIDVGQKSFPGLWPGNDYYWPESEPEPIERPDMRCSLDKTAIVADGADTATLSGVPEGATVKFGAQSTVADADGTVELTATEPVKLSVRVKLWPYKEWEEVLETKEP